MVSDAVPAADVLREGLQVSVVIAGREPVAGTLAEIGQVYIGVTLDGLPVEAYIDAPPADTTVGLRFAGNSCVYTATSGFRGASLLPKQMWYVATPEFLERQQQREYVRVPALLPLSVKLKNIYGTYGNAHSTTTLDISGDGLCFAAEEAVTVPSVIAFVIEDLPGMNAFPIEGEVVRCMPVVNQAGRTVYHVGVTFRRHLTRGMRAHLLRAVTALQRAALRRGMGIR